MKTIEIVFTGAIREITKLKSLSLELDNADSYQDLVERLAERFPALVGTLISSDHHSLLSANLFNRNGEEPILPDQMNGIPADGERLVLLSFIVGG